MIKFINILSNVITEAKRIKLDPTTYLELSSLADKLWAMRNKTFTKKTQVDGFPFKTSDGVDGFIKIVVNPRLKHIGYMETRPKYSRDPMDFVMELQPKEYGSKKNLCILDDVYTKKLDVERQKRLTKLISYTSSHRNVSILITNQDYHEVPPNIRRLMNIYEIGRAHV